MWPAEQKILKFFFRGPHSIKKITYSRATDLPFAGRSWPAGRSLPTPVLDGHFKFSLNFKNSKNIKIHKTLQIIYLFPDYLKLADNRAQIDSTKAAFVT